LRPWVGSSSCWAFCTKLERFNIGTVVEAHRAAMKDAASGLGDPGVGFSTFELADTEVVGGRA